MDALSSPACTLLPGSGGGALPTTARHEPLLIFAPTSSAASGRRVSRPHLQLSNKPKPPNPPIIAAQPPPKTRSSRDRDRGLARPLPSSGHTATPAVVSHTQASTGYALALLDAARCSGVIEAVRRDALRLLWEGADGLAGALQEGGLCWQTAALVRMLLRKGKGGLVGEVMREVCTLCDELVIGLTTGRKGVAAASSRRLPSFAYSQ